MKAVPKHILVSIVLILAVASGGGGLAVWMIVTRPKPQQVEPQRVAQMVLAPPVEARDNYRVRIVAFGSARPRVRLQIAPQVAGVVVAKAENFLSGKYVRQGQMLFRIDKTDYVQARDAAQRQIELLQTQLARLEVEQANLQATEKIERGRLVLAGEQLAKARKLLNRGAAGENDVDAALEAELLRKSQLQSILNQLALIAPQRHQLEAQIAAAEVQLEQALTAIARTDVTCPVTGRVLECGVEVGERVAVGQVCGDVYGTDVMDVPVPVPAGDLAWLDRLEQAGSAATTRPAAGGGQIPAEVVWHQPDNGKTITWRGRVERIEAGLAAQTRTATLVVEVDNPSPASGKPLLDLNMFCEVTVLGRTLPRAFLLPRRAILADKTSVYVVNSGRLTLREVSVARLAGEEAMLLPGGGVGPGERVIIGYVPKPVLGMHVRAVDELPRSTTDGQPGAPAGSTRPAGALGPPAARR